MGKKIKTNKNNSNNRRLKVLSCRKKVRPDKFKTLHRLENIAIDTSINAISFADMRGKVTYVNRAFLDLFGFKKKTDVIGRPTYGFCTNKKSALKMRRQLIKQSRWVGEMELRRKDSSVFFASLSANLVKDEKGSPLYTMAFFVDITEIKNTIEAIKQSEKNFKMLFFGAAEGIIAADIKTKKFILANPAVCRCLGFSGRRC